jgi:hypothetical protein
VLEERRRGCHSEFQKRLHAFDSSFSECLFNLDDLFKIPDDGHRLELFENIAAA